MIVYIDTGVFIDYLIYRGQPGIQLRKKKRRGRIIKTLCNDATKCLDKMRTSHSGVTSALMLYELEHSVFMNLQNIYKKVKNKTVHHIMAARPAILQGLVTISNYNISLINVDLNIMQDVFGNINLQSNGIQIADSIHIISAMRNNAELIISTDQHILNLDNILTNMNGTTIRCLDTNDALKLL